MLCQSRDTRGWHGTRSNKAVTGMVSIYNYVRVEIPRVGMAQDLKRL